jgi:hypothetical protein
VYDLGVNEARKKRKIWKQAVFKEWYSRCYWGENMRFQTLLGIRTAE